MIGISSCLTGVDCTYRGDSNYTEWIKRISEQEDCLFICPEVLGHLPIPRDPSEIVSFNPLVIKTNKGKDVTQSFVEGAQTAYQQLKAHNVECVILKSNSPSCGRKVYDGTFSHQLINKSGVLASLLEKEGIPIFDEHDERCFHEFLVNLKNNEKNMNHL